MLKISYIYGSEMPKKEADNIQVLNNVYALKKSGLDITLLLPKTLKNLFISDNKLIESIASYFSKNQNFIPVKTLFSFPFYYKNIGRFFHDPIAVMYSKYKGYDYIYTRDLLAVFWARIFNMKIIFETYRRFYKEHPLLFKLFLTFTKKNIKAYITHSELSRLDLISGGVDKNIVKPFHNGFDAEEMTPVLSVDEARNILKLDVNKFIASYTGKVSVKKGLFTLLDLAKENVWCDFYLIGTVEANSLVILKNFIKTNNLNNIFLIDYLTSKDLTKYLYASNVLIIPPSKSALEHGRTVLPIKTFQYLAVGRAILAPEQDDTKEILTHMKNALLVKNGNILEATSFLKLLRDDENLRKMISAKAKDDSLNYSWDNRAQKISTWFKEIL